MSQLLERADLHRRQPALTPTEVRARARRLKREHGLGLIVVDYLQLMQVPGTKENRATEISEISRCSRRSRRSCKVPVIALSQLNRGVEQRTDKKPVMSDLRESGAIEQDGDLIMFIYREEVYDQNTTAQGHRRHHHRQAAQRPDRRGAADLPRRVHALREPRAPSPTARARSEVAAGCALSIDTAALRHNLARVRALAPGCRVIAVIKANAYGHGLVHGRRGARGCGCLCGRAARGRPSRCARRGARPASCCWKASAMPSSSRPPRSRVSSLFVHQRRAARAAGSLARPAAAPRLAQDRHRHAPARFRARSSSPAAIARLARLPARGAAARACDPPRRRRARRRSGDARAARGFRDRDRGSLPGERSIANSAGLIAWPDARARLGTARHHALRRLAVRRADRRRPRAVARHDLRDAQSSRSRTSPPGDRVGYGGTWTRAARIAHRRRRRRLRRRLPAQQPATARRCRRTAFARRVVGPRRRWTC